MTYRIVNRRYLNIWTTKLTFSKTRQINVERILKREIIKNRSCQYNLSSELKKFSHLLHCIHFCIHIFLHHFFTKKKIITQKHKLFKQMKRMSIFDTEIIENIILLLIFLFTPFFLKYKKMQRQGMRLCF